jgi:hypothetical protein
MDDMIDSLGRCMQRRRGKWWPALCLGQGVGGGDGWGEWSLCSQVKEGIGKERS